MTPTDLETELRHALDVATRAVGPAQRDGFARFVAALERLIDHRIAHPQETPTP